MLRVTLFAFEFKAQPFRVLPEETHPVIIDSFILTMNIVLTFTQNTFFQFTLELEIYL